MTDATEATDAEAADEVDVEALEAAIFLVEADPMTAEEAFGEEIAEVAAAEVEADAEVVEVADASTEPAPEAFEEQYDDDCVVEPLTTDDALAIAAESQQRLVASPRTNAWGRLWWLARIAGDQARTFAIRSTPADVPTGEGSAIATVNDDD